MNMCTERYIDPFTDFGFKRMFGSDRCKGYLINFLNSLLGDEDKIVDITYRNTEQLGLLPGDRNAIYDLYCTTDKNGHIIVEMQNSKQKFFIDRAVYYSTFPIQKAAEPGSEWNYQLPKVYMVAFLNFVMGDYAECPNYKHDVKLVDVATGNVFYQKLNYIFLEMPKFIKSEEELSDRQEDWLYVIKNLAKLPEIPERLNDELFQSFFHLAEVSKLSPEEYEAYEISLKRQRDNHNVVVTAREEGREEGRAEEKLTMAQNLKRLGIPLETIAEASGLSIEEIRNL